MFIILHHFLFEKTNLTPWLHIYDNNYSEIHHKL